MSAETSMFITANGLSIQTKLHMKVGITMTLLWHMTSPTRIPHATGQYANLLDLFLTSCPEKCSTYVLSPLGTSDHFVVSVKIDAKSEISTDAPFHRTVFRYSKADWDSFRSFMADASLSHIFNQHVEKAACLTSDGF